MSGAKQTLKTQALYIMLWQLLPIFSLAIIVWLVQGIEQAFSSLLGGLCYWLPAALLVPCLFSRVGASAAKRFLVIFLIGEMSKLFLSALLFVLLVKYLPVSVLFMLVGFVGAIIAFWVVCGLNLGRMG